MNLCGKLLTEREGKSIVLAFFLVVAIKSNLSTFAAAKIQNKSERGSRSDLFFQHCDTHLSYHDFLRLQIVAVDKTQDVYARHHSACRDAIYRVSHARNNDAPRNINHL